MKLLKFRPQYACTYIAETQAYLQEPQTNWKTNILQVPHTGVLSTHC